MADETFDEDIFDDLYDEEPAKPASAPAPAAPAVQADPGPTGKSEPGPEFSAAPPNAYDEQTHQDDYATQDSDAQMGGSTFNQGTGQGFNTEPAVDDNYGPINVKEDG